MGPSGHQVAKEQTQIERDLWMLVCNVIKLLKKHGVGYVNPRGL